MYPETVFRGLVSVEAAILTVCVVVHYLTFWSII
jgi:hypothetical protein